MDKEELLVRIKNAAQALVHQAERLSQPAPTRTDFEATLANVRSLYEYISVLNYLQRYGQRLSAESATPAPRPAPQAGATDVAAVASPHPIPVTEPAPISQPARGTSTEKKTTPLPEPSDVQKSAVKPVTPEPAGEAVLADRLRLMPVDDLRKAISLADKFQYIYELFGGENNAYHAALDALNAMQHKTEAEQYLNELAALYAWDAESDTVLRFRELVAKRFAL